jgi:octaprenyl-diphosphate synthase
LEFLEMESTSTVRHLRSAVTAAGDKPNQTKAGPGHDGSARELLQTLYGPILDPLAQVEQRLHDELQSPYEALVPLLRHGTQLGGKRLRPAMLLLTAAATGQVNDDHLVLATVIEMVHTATLIHDDVLDGAETRRHVPTVNARWDNHTSILLGDYLFAQSFRLAATLPSTDACRQIGEASRRVCEGEMRQILQRDLLSLDEESYFEIIRGKTAELCQVACQLGARYAGADQHTVERLAVFGDAVGIAFQIADDFLDLWGDDTAVGKTLGTDLQQGKMTLPLIHLLESLRGRDRDRLVGILQGPPQARFAQVRPLLQQSDARQYTRDTAEQFRNRAIGAIELLPESPAKNSLRAIANFSVDRRF